MPLLVRSDSAVQVEAMTLVEQGDEVTLAAADAGGPAVAPAPVEVALTPGDLRPLDEERGVAAQLGSSPRRRAWAAARGCPTIPRTQLTARREFRRVRRPSRS